MGRTRLSANFKSESGMALSEFVQRQKPDEGKRLLRFTDKSAAATAAYLGYSSAAHFTTVFKKYFGCTPPNTAKNTATGSAYSLTDNP